MIENPDLESAFAQYERAKALAPNWKAPLYGMAQIREHQERWDDALELYNRGLDLPAADEDDRSQDEEARIAIDEAHRSRDGVVTAEQILDWRSKGQTRGTPKLSLPGIFFKHASFELLPAARQQLDELMGAMQNSRWGDQLIWFVGHASPDGWARNDWLSEMRVKSVRDYVRARVPGAKIEVAWMGEKDPMWIDKNTVDMDKSRRVELRFAAPPAWSGD